jgi:hypothetical protein
VTAAAAVQREAEAEARGGGSTNRRTAKPSISNLTRNKNASSGFYDSKCIWLIPR